MIRHEPSQQSATCTRVGTAAAQDNYARRLMALYYFLSPESNQSAPALREKVLMGAAFLGSPRHCLVGQKQSPHMAVHDSCLVRFRMAKHCGMSVHAPWAENRLRTRLLTAARSLPCSGNLPIRGGGHRRRRSREACGACARAAIA